MIVWQHQWCVHCSELEFGALRPLSEQSSSWSCKSVISYNEIPKPVNKNLFGILPDVWSVTNCEALPHISLTVADVRVHAVPLWGHIYFRGPPVVIRLFFVRCVYYTYMLSVISLSFIVLPELVKHILVTGVVRRNIKFNVKISSINTSQSRCTQWCGGWRCDADPRRK